jgi:hypothetical protein
VNFQFPDIVFCYKNVLFGLFGNFLIEVSKSKIQMSITPVFTGRATASEMNGNSFWDMVVEDMIRKETFLRVLRAGTDINDWPGKFKGKVRG